MKKIMLSVALVLASMSAFAAKEGSFYAGVDANRARISGNACPGGGISCDDTDYTWGVFGGYTINSTFSAEAGYADLGHYSMGPLNADVDAWEVAGLAKYSMWEDAWFAYARAGWAYTSVDANFSGGDDNSSDFVYGVGAEIPLADAVDMRIDWRDYSDVMGSYDISAWSVSGIYNF